MVPLLRTRRSVRKARWYSRTRTQCFSLTLLTPEFSGIIEQSSITDTRPMRMERMSNAVAVQISAAGVRLFCIY